MPELQDKAALCQREEMGLWWCLALVWDYANSYLQALLLQFTLLTLLKGEIKKQALGQR